MHSIKYLFIASALTLGSMWLPANAKTTQLTIALKDGKTVVLDLTAGGTDDARQLPVMTFTPTSVKVVLPPKPSTEPGGEPVSGSTYEFEVSDLASMETSDDASSINDISAPSADLNITYRGGDLILISGNVNIADIMVYDITGKRQNIEIGSEADGVTVSLASLNNGIYILHTGVTSIKIAKK